MSRLNVLLLFLVSVTYYGVFFLNEDLFSSLDYTDHVNWIFLPSGMILGFVLVLEEIGALGIFMASLVINLQIHTNETIWTGVVTSLISAITPMIARQICTHWIGLDQDLRDLNYKKIIECSIIFALISSAIHQLWFHYEKLDATFIADLWAMFVGDVSGSLLVLFLGVYSTKLYRYTRDRLR